MKFAITVDRDEDGMWVVECPSIPGCVSQGKTKPEALKNITEAIGLCLEVRAERDLPLTGGTDGRNSLSITELGLATVTGPKTMARRFRTACTMSLLPLLLLLLALPASLQAQFTFTTNAGIITLTGYTGSGGILDIPSGVNIIGSTAFYRLAPTFTISSSVTIPHTVTSIEAQAFFNFTKLTNVTIGANVASIGESAFYNCYRLTNLTLPNSLTNLGNAAFYRCTGLTSVTIPASVTNPTANPFMFCSQLTTINVASANPAYTSVDGVLFNKNQTIIIGCPGAKPGPTYSITNSVTCIGGGTFAGCSNLIGISIPDTVTSIEGNAFANCFRLASITIPENVTNLGSAFGSCSSLTAITIPNRIPNLGNNTFQSCTSLTTATIGDSVTNIGPYAFKNCTSLTTLTNGNKLNYIDAGAFQGCTRFTTAFLAGNAPTRANNPDPFQDAYNLTIYYLLGTTGWDYWVPPPPIVACSNYGPFTYSVSAGAATISRYNENAGALTIPDTIVGLPVTTIDAGAFSFCSTLTNVALGTNVTTIGDSAFQSCTRIATMSIPDSVTTIGPYAFSNCANLTSITVGTNVTSIGSSAFDFCTNLTAIIVAPLNRKYSSIAGVLFNKSQTTLVQYPPGRTGPYTIPNSVFQIGIYAFSTCSRLTSLTISTNVGDVRPWAFNYCSALKSAYFQGNAPSAGSAAFSGASSLTIYYLLGTSGWGSYLGGRPTALWNPVIQTAAPTFGIKTNRFAFNATGPTNLTIVFEASTNFATNTSWLPLQTNTLTNGSASFSDPGWTNLPGRFYRLRSP